jgi:GxxExxY protein
MISSDGTVGSLVASDALSKSVIGEAMHIHRVLGPGFVESIYHAALQNRLTKIGLNYEGHRPLSVYFEGDIIGTFETDIIVEGRLLLELKAVVALATAHEVQLVNYLTATRIDVGLLLNFGAKSLEIKRRTRGYTVSGVRESCEPEYSQSS